MSSAQFVFFLAVSVTVFLAALMLQFRFFGGLVLRLALSKTRDDLDRAVVGASVAEAAGTRPVAGADAAAVDWLRQTYPANLRQIRYSRAAFALLLVMLAGLLIAGKLSGLF